MSSEDRMDVNADVKAYVKLRDYLEEAKKEFDQAMARPKEAMKLLEAKFAKEMQDTNQSNLKCTAGTVSQIRRTSTTVKDRDEYFKWCIKNRQLEAMDIRANKKIVRELLDAGHEIPGIKHSESIQIGVRRGNIDE